MRVSALMALINLVVVSGCHNQAPSLQPLEASYTAYVSQRFELELVAFDADVDPISFGYTYSGVRDISSRAEIIDLGARGVFTFTPIGLDVGVHPLTFWASDGGGRATRDTSLVVRPTTTGESAPEFVEPSGEGEVYRQSDSPKITIALRATDPDSLSVTFGQAPEIEGSSIVQSGSYSAVFSWTPTDDQWQQGETPLNLWVSDEDNPPVEKVYLLILRTD